MKKNNKNHNNKKNNKKDIKLKEEVANKIEIDKAIDDLFDKEIILKDNNKIEDNNEVDSSEFNIEIPQIVSKEEKDLNIDGLDLKNDKEVENAIDLALEDNSKVEITNDEIQSEIENKDEELDNNVNNEISFEENINSNIELPELTSNEENSRENMEENKKEQNPSKPKDKMYISYEMRLLINIILIILFFILSVVLFVSSIAIKQRNNVVYKQTSNLDYKVYLKPNDYYKEPYLQKNMQYIANLIDNVNINFNYNFNVNQNINYRYMYYIKADVNIADSQDKAKVIYSKTDRLTNPVVVTKENSNQFNINENVKVNYSKYNDLVKSFKSSYGISASSNLTLTLCLEIKDEKGNIIKNINSSDSMKIIIPLTEQMINIEMDYKEINNSDNASVYKEFYIGNKVKVALSIISLLLFIASTIKLVLFMLKTSSKKTAYDATLNKILREYDRVIVNSRKDINVNKKTDVIDVNSFNELLDVRDNLEKPIIFHEIHKGLKSVFMVKTSNETYRYILKLADLEKETKK